jgi:hypothetical protein
MEMSAVPRWSPTTARTGSCHAGRPNRAERPAPPAHPPMSLKAVSGAAQFPAGPVCNRVPPTAATRGSEAGHSATGKGTGPGHTARAGWRRRPNTQGATALMVASGTAFSTPGAFVVIDSTSVDGDGTLGISCGIPQLKLVGSHWLLSAFVDFLGPVSSGRPLNVRPARNIYVVSTSYATAKVIERLYVGASVALDRKAAAAAEILLSTGRRTPGRHTSATDST